MLLELARNELEERKFRQTAKYPVRGDQVHMLFMDVCSFISNHCTETLRSDELAQMVGYSKSYFERMFSEFIGISFHDFLLKQRLQHSKRLLIQSNEPITNIAHISGFNSIATFNRCFQQYEGMSPSDYRQLKEYHQYAPEQE